MNFRGKERDVKPWRDLTLEEKIERHAQGEQFIVLWLYALTLGMIGIVAYLIVG